MHDSPITELPKTALGWVVEVVCWACAAGLLGALLFSSFPGPL